MQKGNENTKEHRAAYFSWFNQHDYLFSVYHHALTTGYKNSQAGKGLQPMPGYGVERNISVFPARNISLQNPKSGGSIGSFSVVIIGWKSSFGDIIEDS